MRLYKLLLSMVAGVLIISGACSAAKIVPIGGKVIDVKGKPVAGVRVIQIQVDDEVVPRATIRRETTSDSTGRFTLPAVEGTPADEKNQNAETALIAHKPGMWVGFTCLRDAKADQKVFTVTVSAPKTEAGQVTDITGKPIEGAKVKPEYLSWDDKDPDSCGCMPAEFVGQFVGMVPVLTDAQGKYLIENIPSHMELSCQAAKPGFAVKPYWMASNNSDAIVLVPAGSASGRVIDSAGKGVKGVHVTAMIRGNSSDDSDVITAEDGSFVLDGIVPGKFTLQLQKSGPNPVQRPTRSYYARVNETVQLQDVLLQDSVVVECKVVDSNTGKPLVGANVSAGGEDWLWHAESVKSDSNGCVKIMVLPGRAQITYSGGLHTYYYGDSSPSDYVDVPPTGLKNLTIKVRKMKIARGKVVDSSGRPIKGIEVSIAAEHSLDPVKTDARGIFVIPVPPLEDDQYSMESNDNMHIIVADDPAGKRGVSKRIDRNILLKKDIVLKVLPYKTVKVLVKDMSGKPFAGVEVQASERQGHRGYQRASVTTDAKGIAVLDKLCPGTKIEIYASSDDQSGVMHGLGTDLIVGGPNWKDQYTFTLKPEPKPKLVVSKFTGMVVDQSGKPVAGAFVTTRTNMSYIGTTDANGNFVLLPDDSEYHTSYDDYSTDDGVRQFTVIAADRSQAVVTNLDTGILGTEDLLLRVSPIKTLKVKVVDDQGKPLSGVTVDLGPSNSHSADDSSDSDRTDQAGEVTFRYLSQGGVYDISAKLSGYYFEGETLPRVGSGSWTDDVVVTMDKAQRTQKGVVLGPDGKPISGVHVGVSINGHPGAVTDSKGEFVLKNMPDREIRLYVHKKRLYGSAETSKGKDKLVIKLRKDW